MLDLFIINNGSCVLLSGSERDKAEFISPLLYGIIEPEIWTSHITLAKKCFILMEQINV